MPETDVPRNDPLPVTVALYLDGTDHDCLPASPSRADIPAPEMAPMKQVAFVHLHVEVQFFPFRLGHGEPDLLQPGPASLVTAHVQLPLEVHRAHPSFLGHDGVDRPEPIGEGLPRLPHHGVGDEGLLDLAGFATDKFAGRDVGVFPAPAMQAFPALRPPLEGEEVFEAFLVRAEMLHEVYDGFDRCEAKLLDRIACHRPRQWRGGRHPFFVECALLLC